jgi:hypothetical protein
MHRHSFPWTVLLLAGWLVLLGSANPAQAGSEPFVSVSADLDQDPMFAFGDGGRGWIFILKIQGAHTLTAKVVLITGGEVKTIQTVTAKWESWPKEGEIKKGRLLLLEKRNEGEHGFEPVLGYTLPGAGILGTGPNKVTVTTGDAGKGKESGMRTTAFASDATNMLGPKEVHQVLRNCYVTGGGLAGDLEPFAKVDTLDDAKTASKKNPKVTVIVLMLSWIPAE